MAINHPPIARPPQYDIGISELGTMSQGDNVDKPEGQHPSFRAQKNAFEKDGMISPSRFFMHQWGTLFLVCILGVTLGIAATAIFRNVKSSTIALVILFITFMVFSRAFVEQTTYMYSLSSIPQGELNPSEMKWIVPISFSFLGISRYVFNVMSYPAKGWFLLDWIPLCVLWVASLAVAMTNFASKSKNWREISR